MVRALGYSPSQGNNPARFFLNAELVAPVIRASSGAPDLMADLIYMKSNLTTQVRLGMKTAFVSNLKFNVELMGTFHEDFT